MSTSTKPTLCHPSARPAAVAQNRYGHFTADGSEYVIQNPRTPRPWVNVISNPRLGLAVSQTGSGFTWIDNSQLGVITRWEQDLAQDRSGKFLYLRDTATGQFWSLTPAPIWPAYDDFACHHGLGYTTFRSSFAGIRATWTLFCDARDTLEYWLVELENLGRQPRRVELAAYLEWCCGVAPSPRREFHKLFIDTRFDRDRRAVFARNHMWEVPSNGYGHWNMDFPYVSALACSEPVLSAQGDKSAFLGRYGDLRAPAALTEGAWKPEFGRHADAVAALQSALELRPGETRRLGYVLAVGATQDHVERLVGRTEALDAFDRALAEVRDGWRSRLAAQRIETPDATVNFLTNDWVRYQAISARIWGRAGYYQQSGAYGFRDQLQDSQVWLTIDPTRTRQQINLHAGHQFADGSVYHWWHPLSEQGHITKMTDDLLWLAFVTANYIKETGQLDILNDPTPFLDDPHPQSLAEHVRRAFARVRARTSPRGLPYIGAGDWNDGFSAVGLQERGESIWLAQFLAGLCADWAEICRRTGDPQRAAEFDQWRAQLVAAVNEHGWDGAWYLAATRDDGEPLGSSRNRVCRVYLNTQTWAILNDIAPPQRAAQCLAAVRTHLVSEAGALLLAPAFDRPMKEVGYITRYAPGLRENGGVYTHAATWAIAAAAKAKDAELVERLLTAINPAVKDPERYWAEPYVLPGNVDGPDSPHHGRAGWTWYTGSAQWLHRVVTQWVLGVRPEWDGLRLDPCLPASWPGATMERPYRGATYRIRIERAGTATAAPTSQQSAATPSGNGNGLDSHRAPVEVWLDGQRQATDLLPPPQAGAVHEVRVILPG